MYFKYKNDRYTLESNLAKLDEIANFKENWNGYGAKPHNLDLIESVRDVLQRIEKAGLPQPFLAPAPEMLQIEWGFGDEPYLELEFRGDHEFLAHVFICQHDGAGFKYELEGTVQNDDIEDFLQQHLYRGDVAEEQTRST